MSLQNVCQRVRDILYTLMLDIIKVIAFLIIIISVHSISIALYYSLHDVLLIEDGLIFRKIYLVLIFSGVNLKLRFS